jgi:hypothetical protein
VGKPERKRQLGRLRRRLVNNIKTDLRDGMDWIGLTQDWDQWKALMNTVMNLGVIKDAGKFLSSCTSGDLSRTQLHGVSFLKISHTANSDIKFLRAAYPVSVATGYRLDYLKSIPGQGNPAAGKDTPHLRYTDQWFSKCASRRPWVRILPP